MVAPSGPFEPALFEAGVEILRRRYTVDFAPSMSSRHRYLAGDDSRRFQELQAAFDATDLDAIFCARGGYGAMRLLKGLKVPMRNRPFPILCGFSDITALHLMLQQQGIASLHGPVLTQLGRQPADVVERLFLTIESDAPPPRLTGTDTYVGGKAQGPLIGGNLSVFSRLLGTPYMPSLQGAVLFLEDVGERPYRLDRMWTHLELAGVFEQVRGIVLGDFTGCDDKEPALTANEILRELAVASKLPCAAGFRVGHGDVNYPVPFGIQVRLDADAQTLDFDEPFTTKKPAGVA